MVAVRRRRAQRFRRLFSCRVRPVRRSTRRRRKPTCRPTRETPLSRLRSDAAEAARKLVASAAIGASLTGAATRSPVGPRKAGSPARTCRRGIRPRHGDGPHMRIDLPNLPTRYSSVFGQIQRLSKRTFSANASSVPGSMQTAVLGSLSEAKPRVEVPRNFVVISGFADLCRPGRDGTQTIVTHGIAPLFEIANPRPLFGHDLIRKPDAHFALTRPFGSGSCSGGAGLYQSGHAQKVAIDRGQLCGRQRAARSQLRFEIFDALPGEVHSGHIAASTTAPEMVDVRAAARSGRRR